ncbi:ParB/Srx family N-terminal domain-containing protein [Noviherbaspirillum sp.]|uniref:ParB/Srx family N-terminal domain-containing protein n=1 Tax=Noviherbaspirillum sp. TaxID=1926288 RepID=UPI002B4887A8|nr:ParB/Srx family N-terminal domain-containing protein [Noviherbaspirillum sp.]HJV81455.1 ParB/Srx family N-terminal domain-containing protein [Noviherbaspirillum sp.]
MHRISTPLLMAIAACVASSVLAEPVCSRSVPVDAKCEIALSALHPTQPAVGMIPVEERAARFKGDTDFVRYTSKRPMPVVQAPDGTFYLTDGHHLASVLWRVGADKVMAQVIGRIDNPATFWQEMQARHWVYLHDPKGNPIPPSALPQKIADLADDPYRALATYAQAAGYFKRTDAYFMEFEWARYFGSHMGWQPIDRMNLLAAIQAAEQLACQPAAKDLPGYAGPCNRDKTGALPLGEQQ